MLANVRVTAAREGADQAPAPPVATIAFTDGGRTPQVNVNNAGAFVKVGSGPEAATALRHLARSALSAAEVLDPQWAGLGFGVCEDEILWPHPLDALEHAVARHRRQTIERDDAEPVQVVLWASHHVDDESPGESQEDEALANAGGEREVEQ